MSAPTPATQTDRAATNAGASKHAHVGDTIVVRGTTAGMVARDGGVTGLHQPDGNPPYDVRRTGSGRVTVHFSGPESCIGHQASDVRGPRARRPGNRWSS
ncbi:DUF1918 domain-containing protein [Streptomyces sp. GbtcB6]|uniref:DUF1918 domain-containing protein n=1 Tax=Streptomyces sp. GbtcB6 TaxID=2824751 RepID=UPI001C2FF328|nr:DUF1918 domain-containing protein [Streptomyces sp. GbtcB6]